MKLLKYLFTSSIIIYSISFTAQTETIEDVAFNTSMDINSVNTVLNGGGLREKYGFMDLYVGALYLEKTSSDDNAIVMSDANMGIRIVIVSGLVT